MELKKVIFDEQPTLTVSEGSVVRINFDVKQTEVNVGMADDKAQVRIVFAAYVVRVEQPLSYDKIVNAIVSEAYPQDKMQAIINNHLLDADDEANEAEFVEMQEWRKKAKTIAKQIINNQ